ncbi:MAG TPA: tryptophan synthase subunit alpha [Phycisphaerae bacterium]|nr:tryptophan synthase subunit alpha [Phycisphaerae bacterium]
MNLANNRIVKAMARLAGQGRKGLLPYVTAGLPDLATTERILGSLDSLGVTAVELGFPYSDSIADGPTIQSSFTRVLEKGIHVRDILGMVASFRRKHELPLLAMLSYSIVFRIGLNRFIEEARSAGIDGFILPDVSFEEAPQIAGKLNEAGLCLPMLVSPASPSRRRGEIATLSTGFVYYMSVTGITGERNQLPPDLVANVRELKAAAGKPVVVGFGISNADHVRLVCSVADGTIIGSALVRRIMEAQDRGADGEAIVKTASDAVREWMTGLR